jgi:aminoglycoside 6'-N-acetyltransferase
MGAAEITFRPLHRSDFARLTAWLSEPRVARWWNHQTTPDALERDFGASIDGTDPTELFVADLDGEPFGLIQRYVLVGEPTFLAELQAVCDVEAAALSIDYLIGEPSMRGRGLATAMIAALAADSWRRYPAVPAIVVAVIAGNEASWRALERAGFHRIAEGEMTPDNPIDPPDHVIYRIERP